MSGGSPYVLGKRVMFPRWPRPVALATFSCHWAAVAALVRLHQPGFASLGGDKREDLEQEPGLREALERAANKAAPRRFTGEPPTGFGSFDATTRED